MNKLLLSTFASVVVLSFNLSIASAATLHVHHASFASWKLDCDVVTNGSKISSIKNLVINPSAGSITNKKVSVSGTSAKIRFTKHLAGFTYHESVQIKFNKNKLYVTN
ncbi:hypothetical protein [uncultured Secundilactobacillus sp.]|uniref:hypothetical protein n=1 Tax=uncultured Secundilactobacillus sp. TaxID=2813935 RepID=UPI00258F11ED|nr:hypothetical protein [uncultured Secundilactobacillus sp.]